MTRMNRSSTVLMSLLLAVWLLMPAGASLAQTTPSVVGTLNDQAYKVAVQTGPEATKVAEAAFPDAQMLYFSTFQDGMLAVSAGKADAFVYDSAVMQAAIKAMPGLILLDETLGNLDNVIGLQLGDDALRAEVDAFIDAAKADGTYDDMYRRWIVDMNGTMPEIPRAQNPTRVLKVGTTGLVEPMSYYNADHVLVGFDVEYAERLAYALNARIEWTVSDYMSMLTALQGGKLDLFLSNLNDSPERREIIGVTKSYYTAQVAVLVRAGTFGTSESVAVRAEDTAGAGEFAALSGQKIGVITGSVQDKVLQDIIPGAIPEYFATTADMLTALQARKIAGYLDDEPVSRHLTATMDGISLWPTTLSEQNYALALPKGNEALLNEIDEVIRNMQADGTLAEMDERWFDFEHEERRVMPEIQLTGERGTLTVANDAATPPFGFIKNGELVGYDIELVERVCAELGYAVNMQVVDFSGIIAGVVTGKYDMAASCITVTEERKERVLFTEPSYRSGIVMVMRTEDLAGITENGDGALPGTTVDMDTPSFWDNLVASFTRTFITESRYKLILRGLWVTIEISLLAAVFGTLLGFGLCMMRRSRHMFLSAPVRAFVRIVQGTPIVVMLMILYYVVFSDPSSSAIFVAVVGFTLNFGAYSSEMMRTGMDAVDKGQIEAACAIGFRRHQVFWRITLPQAARHFIPVYKGEFISLLKTTSVVGYISIQDLTKMSDIIRSRTYEAFFPLIATAVIYFVISNLFATLISMLEVSIEPKRRKRVVKGVVSK